MSNFELMNALSDNIRDLMRSRGLTQAALAKQMNVKQPVIGRLLTNPEANPTIGTLQDIASVLGVEVCDLLRKKRKKVAC
jgi:transcriptional regulator with XRE-family HTH domain